MSTSQTMPADMHGNIPEVRVTDDGTDFAGGPPHSVTRGTRDGGQGWNAMWIPTSNWADFDKESDADLFIRLHVEAARKARPQ